jgi:predicted oxidoreductase
VPTLTAAAPGDLVALGATDLRVSRMAWGMWRFAGEDLARARSLVDAVLDVGINLFDTADIYGFNGRDGFGAAETLLGRLFEADPGLRSRMVLASKGGIIPGVPYDSSVAYLTSACESSLRRLRTDHLDLYQVHRPDMLEHPDTLARTLEALVTSGKVRAIGVSNYTPAQTSALLQHLRVPLASTQPEFSPLALEPLTDGTLDLALQRRISVLAWSPLGGGQLVGAGTDERATRVCAELDVHAQRYGVTRAAVVCAWIMAHPAGIIPILGSQQASRIHEATAAGKVRWTRADWYRVLVASRGTALP